MQWKKIASQRSQAAKKVQKRFGREEIAAKEHRDRKKGVGF
jgi:hypothetical protein